MTSAVIRAMQFVVLYAIAIVAGSLGVTKSAHANGVQIELRNVDIRATAGTCVITGYAVAGAPVVVKVRARTGGATEGSATVFVSKRAVSGHFFSNDFRINLKCQCSDPKVWIERQSVQVIE